MFSPSFDLERSCEGPVVGLDEAGIGCWAGDVFAGAAYVPFDTAPEFLVLLNDSKKLTASKREKAFEGFDAAGIRWAVASASLDDIAQLNIRGAALKAMTEAYHALGLEATLALIDGTLVPQVPCATQAVVKGDQKSYAIAAASIAVKVLRDRSMQALHAKYPQYGWDRNAGYGTKQHQEALKTFGVTPHHRPTYAPIKALLEGGARLID